MERPAVAMWSLLWLCLWGVEGLDLPSNNSLAETRARWSCLDCNSSLHWGLDEIWSMDLNLEMPFLLQVEKDFDGSFWTAVSRRTWYASYAAAAAYLGFILLGKEWMKSRDAWDLKGSLALWNLFLAIFSFVGAVRTVPQLLGALWEYGFAYTVCRRAIFYYGHGPAGFWVCLFIFSKYLELIDTVFLVMRKRKVRFLHWYHHFSVLLYCWHAYTWEMPTGLYFAAMNYSVHAVMYFYYFLAGVLEKPPDWALMVTIMQLLQMVVGILVTCCHLHFMINRTVLNCDGHVDNLKAALAMYASYFLLFAHFFAERYIYPPSPKKKTA